MSNNIKKNAGSLLYQVLFTSMLMVMMATCCVAGYALWDMN